MSTDKNKTMQAYTITNNYIYGTNDGNKITATCCARSEHSCNDLLR